MSKAHAALLSALLACNGAPAVTPAISPPKIAPLPAPLASSSSPQLVTATASAASAPETPTIQVTLERAVEGKITALSLGNPPHSAALAEKAVWVHDAKGWRSEALPAFGGSDPPPHLQIFFGRDDKVRVVGTRAGATGVTSIYLRWKPGGFINGGSEIGKLADPKGSLVAVLGEKDPEIVCRPGDICFVKRRTGWTMIKAPADIERVVLGDDVGWGTGGKTLYKLDGTLKSIGPPGPWKQVDDLFALRDRAWIVETSAGMVHAFDGTAWRSIPAPIKNPRALWGSSEKALWLVGDGIAFYDGSSFRVAKEAPNVAGPFTVVTGRAADDVWVAGDSGVFKLKSAL